MSELELKHIVPYLPYGLEVVEVYRGKLISDAFIVDVVNWNGGNVGGSDASLDSFELERAFHLRDIKPILRPIDSISNREIKELGQVVFNEYIKTSRCAIIASNANCIWLKLGDCCKIKIYLYLENNIIITAQKSGDQTPIGLNTYKWLFEHHFDVFGLIEKGLAIDINTIE